MKIRQKIMRKINTQVYSILYKQFSPSAVERMQSKFCILTVWIVIHLILF